MSRHMVGYKIYLMLNWMLHHRTMPWFISCDGLARTMFPNSTDQTDSHTHIHTMWPVIDQSDNGTSTVSYFMRGDAHIVTSASNLPDIHKLTSVKMDMEYEKLTVTKMQYINHIHGCIDVAPRNHHFSAASLSYWCSGALEMCTQTIYRQ